MRPSDNDLAFAADVRARDAAHAAECKARGFVDRHGWTSYPSETVFDHPAPSNAERSRAERIEFCSNPLPYGQSYTAYLTKNPEWTPTLGVFGPPHYFVTTWTGERLATVTRISSYCVRGDTRGSFWARGIDGRMYYGRHNGEGAYCRMRLAKHQ